MKKPAFSLLKKTANRFFLSHKNKGNSMKIDCERITMKSPGAKAATKSNS
jgi:hypothetical protein